MSLRIITLLNRRGPEIVGIGITEYGKNSYLDLKDVYENQVRIYNEIKNMQPERKPSLKQSFQSAILEDRIKKQI